MTETNTSQTQSVNVSDKVQTPAPQSAYNLQLQARLKAYQEREEAM